MLSCLLEVVKRGRTVLYSTSQIETKGYPRWSDRAQGFPHERCAIESAPQRLEVGFQVPDQYRVSRVRPALHGDGSGQEHLIFEQNKDFSFLDFYTGYNNEQIS